MRKLLVLGGAGFIGTNLVDFINRNRAEEILVLDKMLFDNNLVKAGIKCEFIKADINENQILSSILKSFHPDQIIHLAANSDIKKSSLGINPDLKNTLGTTLSLASALARHPVQSVVFASTGAVYGVSSSPLREDSPKYPISAYGWMKLASEEVLLSSLKNQNIQNLLIARFPNVTGFWQTHGVVYDLANSIKKNPKKLQVLGDGTQRKPYCSAATLSRALMEISDQQRIRGERELVVNLSPSDDIEVSEIVNELCLQFGVNPQIDYGTKSYGWEGDVPRYSYDTSRSKNYLGGIEFEPSISVIRESVKWASENL
jgi:UDP-glucose 4-epimerase